MIPSNFSWVEVRCIWSKTFGHRKLEHWGHIGDTPSFLGYPCETETEWVLAVQPIQGPVWIWLGYYLYNPYRVQYWLIQWDTTQDNASGKFLPWKVRFIFDTAVTTVPRTRSLQGLSRWTPKTVCHLWSKMSALRQETPVRNLVMPSPPSLT